MNTQDIKSKSISNFYWLLRRSAILFRIQDGKFLNTGNLKIHSHSVLLGLRLFLSINNLQNFDQFAWPIRSGDIS